MWVSVALAAVLGCSDSPPGSSRLQVHCPSSQVSCGDVCADLSVSLEHCGTCDHACPAVFGCVAGACVPICPEETPTLCGFACVDTLTDRKHCGGCVDAGGDVCGPGEICAAGVCGLSCGGSTPTLCGDACVNTNTSRSHCGGCADAGGTTCGAGQVCSGGVCTGTCSGSTPTLCGDVCVNPNTDRNYCGGCLDAGGVACVAGEVCSEGLCVLSCGGSTPTLCGDACVNTTADRNHCGGCAGLGGVVCGAGQVCSGGQCLQSCGGSTPTLCGDACVNTSTDRNHCGGCAGEIGVTCGPGELCSDGVCALTCGGATPVLCGGVCTDTLTDAYNCGACAGAGGTICDLGQVCAGGLCSQSCGGSTPVWCGGLCVDPRVDPANCGGCADQGGVVCALDQVCSGGNCALTCSGSAPLQCGRSCANPDTNRGSCGGCAGAGGSECAASQVCVAGTCTVGCGGATPTQCGDICVNTEIDPRHCGGCSDQNGAVCSRDQVCSGGRCELACGGDNPVLCGDVCVNTDTDHLHCGGCAGETGTSCVPGEVCALGVCATSCDPLLACGSPSFCVDPLIDPDYCGATGDCLGVNAGERCSTYDTCAAGTCQGIDAELIDLRVSAGELSPVFSPTSSTYLVLGLSVLDDALQLTPVASDPRATITVNGVVVASGSASVPVPLDFGITMISVVTYSAGGVVKEVGVIALRPSTPTYLKAPVTRARFGAAMSASGDRLAVGAPKYGWVYLFRKLPDGWVLEASVRGRYTSTYDQFGISVALEGDLLVVGANWESANSTGVNGSESNNLSSKSGAAYVFRHAGATWTQEAFLKPSNTEANDNFGTSVALSGTTVVVGAVNEDSSATGVNPAAQTNDPVLGYNFNAGAAYVFNHDGSRWAQSAYIKAPNTGTGDAFGNSVAISGDTMVVGARYEDSLAAGVNPGDLGDDPTLGTGCQSGAAYVYTRAAGVWAFQTYLKASNPGCGDGFATSLALSPARLVVGAVNEGSAATGVGGDQTSDAAPASGAVYVFTHGGGSLAQEAYVKASNTDAGDTFGWSIAIFGDRLLVGATGEDSNSIVVNKDALNNSLARSGAAYLFVRDAGGWRQKAYLKASNTDAGDQFGYSVALSDSFVVVGADLERSAATTIDGRQADNSATYTGAAYAY